MGPRFGRPPPFGMFGPHGPMGGPPPMGPMIMGPPPGPGGGPPRQKAFMVTHQSFDALMADTHFGKAYDDVDDSALNAALLKKTQELTPTTTEQSSVQNLVSKVILYQLSLTIP